MFPRCLDLIVEHYILYIQTKQNGGICHMGRKVVQTSPMPISYLDITSHGDKIISKCLSVFGFKSTRIVFFTLYQRKILLGKMIIFGFKIEFRY